MDTITFLRLAEELLAVEGGVGDTGFYLPMAQAGFRV